MIKHSDLCLNEVAKSPKDSAKNSEEYFETSQFQEKSDFL